MPPQTTQEPPKPRRRLWIIISIIVLIIGVSVLLFTLVNGKSDQPDPSPDTSSSSQSESKQSDEALARSLKPCELLTDSERAQFNLGAGELDDRNIRGCDWDWVDNLYASLAIYPLYGPDRVPGWGGTSEPITIGSHQAYLSAAPQESIAYGACGIDIAIGPTKSATVKVTANGKFSETPDVQKYCTIVRQIAEYVEAKLP